MKIRWIIHISGSVLVIFLLLILPLLRSEAFGAYLSGAEDAVSSASLVLEEPSGEYLIFLNKERHQKNLELWEQFFRGEDIGIVFEDLICTVPSGDLGALEMARSLASRLPENQLRVVSEDGVLLFSKADLGRYDVICVSKELGEIYGAAELMERDGVKAITIHH